MCSTQRNELGSITIITVNYNKYYFNAFVYTTQDTDLESRSLFSETIVGVLVSTAVLVLLTGTFAVTMIMCILRLYKKKNNRDLDGIRTTNYEIEHNPSYHTTAANHTTAVNPTTDAESDTHIYDEVGQGGANETHSELYSYAYIV